MKLIEFALLKDRQGPKVVCFSDKPVTPASVKITPDLPETWLSGYRWQDLHIMTEAMTDRDGNLDLKSLKSFIGAFIDNPPDIYMTIWHSQLPTTGL